MKKILIIGGASQGKTEFAVKHFNEFVNVQESLIDKNGIKNISNGDNDKIFDTKYQKLYNGIFLDDFHLIMKNMLENNVDYQQFVTELTNVDGWLVISKEIGSGIVPIDKKDRLWREQTGRMLTKIASQADEVYRVFSGIPQKIK